MGKQIKKVIVLEWKGRYRKADADAQLFLSVEFWFETECFSLISIGVSTRTYIIVFLDRMLPRQVMRVYMNKLINLKLVKLQLANELPVFGMRGTMP